MDEDQSDSFPQKFQPPSVSTGWKHLSFLIRHLSLHPQIYNTFPWLMKWLPGVHQTILSQMQHVRDFVKAKVQEHKKDFDPTSPRDYIDCFMAEMGDVRPLFCIPIVCRVWFSFFFFCLYWNETWQLGPVFSVTDRKRTQNLVLTWRIWIFALWTCLVPEQKPLPRR